MIDRILETLARLALRRNTQITIAAVALLILSVLAATRLSFDPDLLNLIPQNNRQVNEFRKMLRDMGTIDYHIVVLDMPAGHDVHEYDTLIESIADGYRKSARIEDVTYKIPNPLDFVDVVLPRALLFLTPQELDTVGTKLSDAGIRESIARNRSLLQTPQGMALKQLIQYDPFNLVPIFLRKFSSAGAGFKLDTSSGYYLSSDHTTLLILMKPKKPAQDVPFAKQLLAEGSLIEASALAKFQEGSPAKAPLPSIAHTGGYQIAAGDADLIKNDVIVNVIGSVIAILALFLYAFRRGASVFYAGAPLFLGLALTFGAAGLVYGTLSSASAGFAALLAGLGIDFITVMYGRYVDERNRGAEMPAAVRTMMRTTLPGVFVASITTAATFYAFLATDFRGMTQLGFLTGTGILLFLLCVTFLLPALIVTSEKRAKKRAPKLYLHSFGAGHVIDFSLKRPRAVIIGWSIFVVACGLLATRLTFSDNIQDLRAKNNIGVTMQEKVTKKFGQSFDVMMYVVDGKSYDDVMDRTYAVTRDLEPLVQDHTIASFQSIGSFLPPRQQQEQVVATLRAGRNDRFSPERVKATLGAALVENGFRPEVYDHYMELFGQAMQPPAPITLANIPDREIAKLTQRFVKQTSTGWMSVIYLYPTGGKWGRDVPQGLLTMSARHPQDVLTGVNLVSGTLRRIVKADAVRSTLLGFALALLLMLISFRSFKMTVLSFVPFVAGAASMLGLMALFGLQFNFMNIFVGLMIIGVGTDYAVYMLQRYNENPPTFHLNAHETGKAVVMAALTAIVGYGSFAISHYPGLRSIGYASLFGIAFSGLAAITLLPAILILIGARNGELSNTRAVESNDEPHVMGEM